MTLEPGGLSVDFFNHSRGPMDDSEIELICERVDAGVPVQHIAQQTGRPVSAVQRIATALREYDQRYSHPPEVRAYSSSLVGRSIHVMGMRQPIYSITLTSRADDIGAALGYQIDPLPVTMRSILCDVARRSGLTIAELKGPRQNRYYSRPRQEAMSLMVQQHKWSLPQIGAFLGGRDHTTILKGAQCHQRRLDEKAAAALPTWSA